MKMTVGIFAHPPKGKLLIPPGTFLRNIFSPKAERAIENYDLLYQNSIRKYEDDLEH